MRDIAAEEITAIRARTVVARDFIWITAKNRSTQADESMGFWNDVMFVTAPVKDGRTGATDNRDFLGVGMALTIGSIPLTSDITIRNVDIDIPYLDSTVAQLVRGYDVRGAPIQIYRGYRDPDTRDLVSAAKPRFVGYVDGSPIVSPKEDGEGSITLHCVSTTRELTRTSSEVRSNESQLVRSAGDLFYADTGVVGDWTLFWGVANTPIPAATTTPTTGSGGTIA